MKLAYVPVVVYVHKSDLHLINIFCVVIVVKKCIMATSGSLLIFYTAYEQDTFGAYDQSYKFCAVCCSDRKMEFNSVVRRVEEFFQQSLLSLSQPSRAVRILTVSYGF